MPQSGYDARKTTSKSAWEGLRGLGIVVAGALAAWGLTPEGTTFLTTVIPVQYLLLLPVAQTLLRAVADYAKHRSTPVKIGADSLARARKDFESGS